ncbi:MAG: hypothetical protein O3A37_10090 [Planctomycetota bacterium]|nr:hypothetical protein [Planctomycetota bacterium]
MRDLLLAIVPGLVMAAVSCADDLALPPHDAWGEAGMSGGPCAACCPVRPEQFGFYATQWRPWPGPVAVASPRPVDIPTPVSPPRSVVPDIDRERDGEPLPPPAPRAGDERE